MTSNALKLFEKIGIKPLAICVLIFGGVSARAEDLIRIGVSDKKLDAFFDLTANVHQIPKMNVILSRPITSVGAKEIEKTLALDINGITRKALLDQFSGKDTDGRFTISGNSDGSLFSIVPWIFINISDDGKVVPWMVWNVEFWDLYWNKKKWAGYCVACLSKPRAIDGKDSWTSNSGKLLEQAVKTDAKKLLEVTKIDLVGGYKGKDFDRKRMKAVWMFGKNPEEKEFDTLEIDAETMMVNNFLDKTADDFFAGGLAGLVLKGMNKNTVLFNGVLIAPKDFGEIAAEKAKPNTTKTTK